MRVCRATSSAALLDIVVGRAAGGGYLGAGVTCAAALDIAGLAGFEGSIFDRGLGDDGGGEGKGHRREE